MKQLPAMQSENVARANHEKEAENFKAITSPIRFVKDSYRTRVV
jgi:hypothetical protein